MLIGYARVSTAMNSMTCEHNKRLGDNYGVSCQECGVVLEGFGYGGWFGSNLKGHERCLVEDQRK
jgi:hypothetical protein